MNNNTTLNLNTASYFINIVDAMHVSTWYITGGPRTKQISLTKHHWRKFAIRWLMVNICEDMGVQYTGKDITKHFGRPYL